MSNCCVCQLGKGVKRAREEEDEEEAFVDRLSILPDVILHHIFSFLDIKYVVQTSVLSRVWRCVWKHAPVLNFHKDSFLDTQIFIKFVNMVLDRRYKLGVCKISFVDGSSLFSKVMSYASSHGTQHLAISLNLDFALSDLLGSRSMFNVETIELGDVPFPNGFGSSSFQKLTTLNLEQCALSNYQQGVVDLISNLPCLMNLVISDCYLFHVRVYKIIGPQLRSLKLDGIYTRTEIVAPRLEFLGLLFSVRHCVEDYQGFSNSSIPSLVHADILVLESLVRNFRMYCKEKMEYTLVNLFQVFITHTESDTRNKDPIPCRELLS